MAIFFALSFLSGLQSMTVPDVGSVDDADSIGSMDYVAS